MTTPQHPQPVPATTIRELEADLSPQELDLLLERRARLENLQQGMRRASALNDPDALPPAGPRDLRGLDTVMDTVFENQAYYYSQPGFVALVQVYRRVSELLENLVAQIERAPQMAIQAARITTLASSLIARYAAEVRSHLDSWSQGDTPGGRAMRTLVRAAELHAAQAAGLVDAQDLGTPRRLMAHIRELDRAIQKTVPVPGPMDGKALSDPGDAELEGALSIGAAADPALDEASQLMTALSELAGHARRAGHRLTLDVRLHGMVETAQLRGFEMISGMARAAMGRYDNLDRSASGRRNIAAMIYHYAEQRLERMRGTLSADESRDFGHYETDPPERYMDALFEESRTVGRELRAKHITRQERTDLQIRFLLAQHEIAAAGADGDPGWGTRPTFPPSDMVAGLQTDHPVEARLDLIDALRRRVENNPFHRDAHYLNSVKDRLALELAGPPELTAEALQADLTADHVRSVAERLVTHRSDNLVASPLALSETPELHLTHAQAERALAVLQTLNVVGPPNGLQPREILVASRNQLSSRLELVDLRLPNLLERQKGSAVVSEPSAPEAPVPAVQPEAVPEPGAAARAPVPAPPEHAQTPTAPAPSAPAEPATTPELPRRDRSATRPHPGNLTARPAPQGDAPSDQDLAKLFAGQENRLLEVSQTLMAGAEARAALAEAHAAAYPAPPDSAPAKAAGLNEAQHNAQQAQQNARVGVR
ncbi:hypothetical protein ACFQ9Z_35845 [Streptomyces sp. NPDC056580]|uniref:hypothetical protein n=1 Tax=Streptomyces sp. NPDC056580 TaxID=3345872 RepID=UPI0036BF9E6D